MHDEVHEANGVSDAPTLPFYKFLSVGLGTLIYHIDSARIGAIANVAANHLIACVGSPKRSHYPKLLA